MTRKAVKSPCRIRGARTRLARILQVGSLVVLSAVVGATAMTVAASGASPEPTRINAPFTDRPVEPAYFAPEWNRCFGSHAARYVDDIHWTTWGSETAAGTGIAGRGCLEESIPGPPFPPEPPEPEGSPVSITLGGRQKCAGAVVYTTYALSLEPGAPTPNKWSDMHSGSFPCNPAAPGCTVYVIAGESPRRGPSDCALRLESLRGHRSVPASWKPRTPPGQVPQLRRVLSAVWKNWGGVRAVGRGAMLDQHRLAHGAETDLLWPAKVELAHPIWCPRLGFQSPGSHATSYMALRLTLYGRGLEEKKGQRGYNASLMARARHLVGKHGLKRRVFRQRATATQSTCGL